MTGEPLLDGVSSALPEDLRAFLECRADSATIRNGPVTWLEIPQNVRALLGGKSPELTVTPGSTPGSALLTIKAGWIGATLPAAVVGGKLSVDTSKLPFLAPRQVATEIRRFVDELNARLAANGKALGPPSIGPDGLTLTKVPLASA